MPADFAQLLRKYRTDRGLSMGELATESKTKTATVSLVEANKRTPPKDSAERWARALKLQGFERRDFLAAAERAKAHAQVDALPYVLRLEQRLSEAIALFEIVVGQCRDRGLQFPQEFTERFEALRENP